MPTTAVSTIRASSREPVGSRRIPSIQIAICVETFTGADAHLRTARVGRNAIRAREATAEEKV